MQKFLSPSLSLSILPNIAGAEASWNTTIC